jgi:hypothetical protein
MQFLLIRINVNCMINMVKIISVSVDCHHHNHYHHYHHYQHYQHYQHYHHHNLISNRQWIIVISNILMNSIHVKGHNITFLHKMKQKNFSEIYSEISMVLMISNHRVHDHNHNHNHNHE